MITGGNAELQFVNVADESTGKTRRFFHRGSEADLGVVRQILVNQEYSLRQLARGGELEALYGAVIQAGQRPLILDAGANIGASVVHWSIAFARAHIVAWEPHAGNFRLLAMNTEGLDVDLRSAAIGSSRGVTSLFDPGIGEWGYRTGAGAAGNTVRVESAREVVAEKIRAGFVPFIAKIDIEGGEDELFSNDTSWVDEFPLLIVELHDWLLPGSANSRNFLRCVAGSGRDFVYVGENIFSIRN